MLIKAEKSEAVTNFLKQDLIINLNVLGVLENVPELEIYVDNLESPKGVVISKGYMHYLYTKDDSFIEEVINTLLKDGFYGFSGVERSIANKIKSRFEVTWESPVTVYYLQEKDIDLTQLKNEVGSIEIKDAETVDEFYTFRSPDSLKTIKQDIEKRPSSAIYKNGEMVCWVLVHDDNSMGIMYTKEQHRNKGYSVDATLDLSSKIIKSGKTPFLQIVEGNNMSPGLAKKCGFIPYGKSDWFGIMVGIPKELREISKEYHKAYKDSLTNDLREMMEPKEAACESMFYFTSKLKEGPIVMEGFKLEEVKDTSLMNTWCNIVSKELDVTPQAISTFIDQQTKYKFYVGSLKGAPVSAAACLNYGGGDYGIYFTSMLTEFRNTEVLTSTIALALKDIGYNNFVLVRALKEQVEIFEEIGFKQVTDK